RAAPAPDQSRRADHRVRRREARGARAPGRRQRSVDPGGLVALRPEARAGRTDRGRRRRRCGVGGGRHERGAPPRTARRDPAQHSRGRARARGAQRPLRDDCAPEPGRGKVTAPGAGAGPCVRPRVRLGAVTYLNARPLVYGLDTRPEFDIRYDIPSECAQLLHAHDTDLGLIPSIEYLRGPRDYALVPGPAVISKGPVASVALFTAREPRDIRSAAMDCGSRTS